MTDNEAVMARRIEELTRLLREAPPMRSIDDPRFQQWRLRVDRYLEQ